MDKQTFAETLLSLAVTDLRVVLLLHTSGNHRENVGAVRQLVP